MVQGPILPVLIVGAGPSGLITALVLRHNGIPVRIIDKEETVRNIGQRGAGVVPRTFELFKLLDVVDEMQSKAIEMLPMRMYNPPAIFHMEKPLDPTPSEPYANMMMLGQVNSEEILRNRLRRLGCRVEFGVALQGFQQHDDHVEAHLLKRDSGQDVSETMRYRWLVGTDGARSVVRKQLGLSFDGESWPYGMIFGDLEIKGVEPGYWHNWGDVNSVLLGLRSTEEENIYQCMLGGNIDLDKVVSDPEELKNILRTATGNTDIRLERVRLLSTWRPHSRMVETFRVGRAFVVGDAAHVHTPFGGQGLNTSMQDAANLSWKLSLVEKGVAAPSLLDTYTEERAPVVVEVLKISAELFINFVKAQANPIDQEAVWRRSEELRQLNVHCRWSSIVVDERSPKELLPVDPYGRNRTPTDVVRAGERAPDAPNLVVLSAAQWAGSTQQTTSLFNIFGVSHHTVLIFGSEKDRIGPVVAALKTYPAELLRVVFVYAEAAGAGVYSDPGYLGVFDRDGHAHNGYQVQNGGSTVIIVRPDGIVGSIVFGVGGVKRYFDGVFSALVKLRGSL